MCLLSPFYLYLSLMISVFCFQFLSPCRITLIPTATRIQWRKIGGFCHRIVIIYHVSVIKEKGIEGGLFWTMTCLQFGDNRLFSRAGTCCNIHVLKAWYPTHHYIKYMCVLNSWIIVIYVSYRMNTASNTFSSRPFSNVAVCYLIKWNGSCKLLSVCWCVCPCHPADRCLPQRACDSSRSNWTAWSLRYTHFFHTEFGF